MAEDNFEETRRRRMRAAQDARKAAAKGVDDRARATADANAAAESRQSTSQPTPTQRENDLAKVGALDIDDKDDDGSGPDNRSRVTRDVTAAPADATYRTRAGAVPAATGHTAPGTADKK